MEIDKGTRLSFNTAKSKGDIVYRDPVSLMYIGYCQVNRNQPKKIGFIQFLNHLKKRGVSLPIANIKHTKLADIDKDTVIDYVKKTYGKETTVERLEGLKKIVFSKISDAIGLKIKKESVLRDILYTYLLPEFNVIINQSRFLADTILIILEYGNNLSKLIAYEWLVAIIDKDQESFFLTSKILEHFDLKNITAFQRIPGSEMIKELSNIASIYKRRRFKKGYDFKSVIAKTYSNESLQRLFDEVKHYIASASLISESLFDLDLTKLEEEEYKKRLSLVDEEDTKKIECLDDMRTKQKMKEKNDDIANIPDEKIDIRRTEIKTKKK
jgi:hypothetical protein